MFIQTSSDLQLVNQLSCKFFTIIYLGMLIYEYKVIYHLAASICIELEVYLYSTIQNYQLTLFLICSYVISLRSFGTYTYILYMISCN